MQNKELAKVFKLTGQLLELHGENPFKSRSYSNAAFKIDRLPQELAALPYDDIENVDGVGKNIAAKIVELLETGKLEYLDNYLQKTPAGVLDMMSLKGIGPKKIRVIWKELEVESLGELLYACHENRLVDLKGFGAKTQDQVRKMIEFRIANQGKFHYSAVEPVAEEVLQRVKEESGAEEAVFTGQLRRRNEIIERIEILMVGGDGYQPGSWTKELPLPVEVFHTPEDEMIFHLVKTTGTEQHIKALTLEGQEKALSEQAIYEASGKPYIAPEMREGGFEWQWSETHQAEDLIENGDLKGCLHNHSTWSDGRNSLEEMARECERLGLEYLGISDHSRSAFYANGLTAERVADQHLEIEALNAKLAPFKIFKGIESDILNDGSLDYDPEVLASFDFIVASVHSNLKMDEEKATNRLLTAIENPYTTILGHPTGRLLLSREGYPIDHKKVIDACADHGVVIELNSNPHRLDLDWRWIDYAVNKGVMISLNPDAHRIEGLLDMKFGVFAARKGGLTKDMTFNALGRDQVEEHFARKRSGRS